LRWTGLWEIAMPMGCRAAHHMNIGCANGTGDYIHPGDPTNVYEKFTVEANPLFGLYHNCNPDPKYLPNGGPDPTAGMFDCDSEDGFDSAHCTCKGKNATSVSFEQFYSDCLNGTVYQHISANLTECEVHCAADEVCAGVAMQDGMDGSSCNLLKQPLIQWDNGHDKSNGQCTAAVKKASSNNVKSDNCACYRFNHEAVGKQSQGSGFVPGMPCSAFNTSSMCEDNYETRCTWKPACCVWDGQSWSCESCTNVTRHDRVHGSCVPNLCSNRTNSDDCDDYHCQWNATAATPYCGDFSCGNYSSDLAQCGAFGKYGCYTDKKAGTCTGGYHHGGGAYSWGMMARETAENLMAGHWYSTQRQGHCDGTAKDCSWRVAAVEKVVNATCVNGKIVAEVEKVNASCFAALPQPNNRTTDGWIECFFNSLFGNSSTGAPALDGNHLQTLEDAALLRERIMNLWLGAFESDDPVTGCAPAQSHNAPDPPAQVTGVQPLTLYVKGGVPATSLMNRNSADSGAVVLQALLCAESDGSNVAGSCELPSAQRASSQRGAVLTAATVEINTFTGQFADCKNNGTAWTCAADWECWCDDYGNGDENPCDSRDHRGVCPCKIWGGCGGGKWPVDSDSSVAVGRRSLKHAAGVPYHLAAVAAGANEYSTTAGGQCGRDENDLCTWAESAHNMWVTADAACVEAAVVAAANRAPVADVSVAGSVALDKAFALGSPCRL
jgi:hypothetical protein